MVETALADTSLLPLVSVERYSLSLELSTLAATAVAAGGAAGAGAAAIEEELATAVWSDLVAE